MGFGIVGFACLIIEVGAGCIEIPQRDRADIMRCTEIAEHPLDNLLRGAIGIDRVLARIFPDGNNREDHKWRMCWKRQNGERRGRGLPR